MCQIKERSKRSPIRILLFNGLPPLSTASCVCARIVDCRDEYDKTIADSIALEKYLVKVNPVEAGTAVVAMKSLELV